MREQVLAALRSVIAKSAYPADVIAAFNRLGDDQRGEPESAMLKIQRMGGGVFSYVVEHCGDITHRMSHMAEYGRLGREYVVDKAAKVLETLESPYGFVKEMGENTRNNIPHTSPLLDEATYKSKLKELSLDYANKHSQLIVYNKPQWLAREAAVALGKWEFNRAEKYLKDLLKIANNAQEYEEQASSVIRDSSGNIKPYSTTSITSSTKVTIYRGENTSSENRGKGGIGYWSLDPEFAVQFTQTGQMHEVMKRHIDLDKIYDATKEGKKLPSANSESDFDSALTIAEEKGYCGVRFSEGKDYSDSVYIFDKAIFSK